MKSKDFVLPVIVISQFCCTALWFAGNGVMDDLVGNFNLSKTALGPITSAVQLGFIIGTLVFAILSIADRYSPSKVFFVSGLLGAICNTGMIWDGNDYYSLLFLRFLTGFFLAGIYPVGMKIAADYFDKGLGKSLGFLVGALVVGTAFPHLLNGLSFNISWQSVLLTTSGMALSGGFLLLILIPDGPYRKAGMKLETTAFFRVFEQREFRRAAFGYFGHMWELYALWAFIPVILLTYQEQHNFEMNISVMSFCIIGVGGLACIAGGYLSRFIGLEKTAFIALSLSCLCCLGLPFIMMVPSGFLFICFMLFWGMVVIADSPLFSTLVAQNASPSIRGTALTIVNCIGFSITIVSIQLLNTMQNIIDSNFIFVILGAGPILGLISLSGGGKNRKR